MPTMQQALVPELVKILGIAVICGTAYLILQYDAPLGAFLPGVAIVVHGWDLGIVLWLPRDDAPPQDPPRPFKPTPAPLHPQGLVFCLQKTPQTACQSTKIPA